MKWKFCEFCYINGHCENQDRGHKCECYGKKLEDKCERLEKQLKIAKKYLSLIKRNVSVGSLAYTYVANAQTEIKELEKNEETI